MTSEEFSKILERSITRVQDRLDVVIEQMTPEGLRSWFSGDLDAVIQRVFNRCDLTTTFCINTCESLIVWLIRTEALLKQKPLIPVAAERSRLICEVLNNKSKEYSTGGDRLANFKQAAALNKIPAEQALWGMATKHLVCVMELINGTLEPTEYMVNEKVGDMINYLLLLIAVLSEGGE